MILNNDGIWLVILLFNYVDVGVFFFGRIMWVNIKFGDLILVDDVNQGVLEDFSFC